MLIRTKQVNSSKSGFSLVELLVVIGIIALLMSLLLPTLKRAWGVAIQVKCASQMHQIGMGLLSYINSNKDWYFPVGPTNPVTGDPGSLGTNLPPDQRWPMIVFSKDCHPLNPRPVIFDSYVDFAGTDPAAHTYMAQWPAKPYTPLWLLCPADPDAFEAHSYVLNQHLPRHGIRFSHLALSAVKNSSQIIVMGEKKTTVRDYYMEKNDFDRVVEPFRHGLKTGSNYLYGDMHVEPLLDKAALSGIDPMDPGGGTTTQPTTPTTP